MNFLHPNHSNILLILIYRNVFVSSVTVAVQQLEWYKKIESSTLVLEGTGILINNGALMIAHCIKDVEM